MEAPARARGPRLGLRVPADENCMRCLSDCPPLRRPWDDPTPRRFLMAYVDGFVLPVPKNKIDAYKAQAKNAGDIWKEHGALDFVECVGDDVPYGKVTSFPRAVLAKENEVVVFSWIGYRNRAEGAAINTNR